MALDLSTVSESQLGEADAIPTPKYIFVPSESITIPGTNDILFHISELGQLILAGFSVERQNGSLVLKNYPANVVPPSPHSELPTNLSVDKCTVTPGADEQQALTFHGPIIVGPQPVDLNTTSNQTCRSCKSEQLQQVNGTSGGGVLHCATQNLNSWLTPSKCETVKISGLDYPLSLEQPVDATLPRSEFTKLRDSKTSGVTEKSANASVPSSVEIEEHNILGRLVCTLVDLETGKSRQTDPPNAPQRTNTIDPTEDVIVSGHNLSELTRFVQRLRRYRQSMGLSQLQLSEELIKHFDKAVMFSQPLLSRFEKLHVTIRAAFRLLPYLQKWLAHVEKRHRSGVDNGLGVPVRALGQKRIAALQRLGYGPNGENIEGFASPVQDAQAHDIVQLDEGMVETDNHLSLGPNDHAPAHGESDNEVPSPESQKQLQILDERPFRKKRTRFSASSLVLLASAYRRNPRPRGAQLTELAVETGHTRESIRIWFCNRRQLDGQTRSQVKPQSAMTS
ncbi:unnamed protein product [Calicophoron daubneyi]|uniref:Homeobox domain-containing protein n=1 Tax=Calicophoron daubneyi TaxID=300641 RepID=A0AAV2T3E0_CALDB